VVKVLLDALRAKYRTSYVEIFVEEKTNGSGTFRAVM
jgi:hypothetical protein